MSDKFYGKKKVKDTSNKRCNQSRIKQKTATSKFQYALTGKNHKDSAKTPNYQLKNKHKLITNVQENPTSGT